MQPRAARLFGSAKRLTGNFTLLILLLLLGALTPQQGHAQAVQVDDQTKSMVDRLAVFLCRTAPTLITPYPISAPSFPVNAPVLPLLVDAEICGLWANAFASKGVLLNSPNLQLKILQSIELSIRNHEGTVGPITKDVMKSSTFITQIKTEADKRVSDLLLLLTGPRLKIVLQKTVEEAAAGKLTLSIEKLTWIMLDAEWMFINNKTRVLAAWDSLYPVHLPIIAPVPTNDQKVNAYIVALAAAFNAAGAPTVTSISPTSGSTAGGTSVTITGTGFTGATGVTIGGTAATGVNVVNATTITCTTPAGTAGTASVVVTTPGGANAANTLFTYVATAPNDPPAASDANYTRGPRQSLKILIADLIANHTSDPEGDARSFTSLGSPTGGGTVSQSGGYIFYMPPAGDGHDSIPYTVSDNQSRTATANLLITRVTPGGLPQSVSVGGGNATVSFAGIPGFYYAVERSLDMMTWTPRQTILAPATGQFQYVDDFSDLGSPPPQAYYRTREVTAP